MRTLTLCDIRLHPSTTVDDFEKAMVSDVMPNAGDPAHPSGTPFVRSLYRIRSDTFPPEYRCVVQSSGATDAAFFGMRRRIHLLGADVGEPRQRPIVGALPSEADALSVLRSGRARHLELLTLHLPLRLIQEQFEGELLCALRDEVGVATRVNNADAALIGRGDTPVNRRTEYVVAVIGDFPRPSLRDDTLAEIRAARAQLIESLSLRHIGTVSDHEPAGE
jgi:hypothetical protein